MDIYPHWRNIRSILEDFEVEAVPSLIDPLLQVNEPAIARARERPV